MWFAGVSFTVTTESARVFLKISIASVRCSGFRAGLVGRISTRASASYPSFCLSHSCACFNTGSIPIVSIENSAGLKNGTSASNSFAISAISVLSVETSTRFTRGHFFADSILQAISGLPQNLRIFFDGIDFDPPLAGIMATIFITYSILYQSSIYANFKLEN